MLINESLKSDFYNIITKDMGITSTIKDGKYHIVIKESETSTSLYPYTCSEDMSKDYDEMLKFFKLYGGNNN